MSVFIKVLEGKAEFWDCSSRMVKGQSESEKK